MKIGTEVIAAEQLPEIDPPFTVETATRGEILDVIDGGASYIVAFKDAPAAIEVEPDQILPWLGLPLGLA